MSVFAENLTYESVLEDAQTFLDALLADLQNTVPGQNNTLPSQIKAHNLQNSSGYGSLNGVKKPVQSPSPTPYQSKLESPTLVSQTQNGSLPRSAANHHHSPYSNNNSLPRSTTPHTPQPAAGNLSELDSLLEDLSNARYNNSLAEKHHSTGYTNGTQSPTTYNFESVKRPSVDSLLDELSNAHTSPLYALPNTPKTPDGQKPGRQVTITVRETTTEKIRGTPSPGYINHSAIANSSLSQKPSAYTSSATKELDDLMASLSDFKVNQGSHQQQTVTDYAKPHQGQAHFESSTTVITETGPDQLDSMLGNLQANMSRQGINTQQKGCCSACDKPIVGQVITALGKTWHPEHFVCNHCQQELGTRNFFERDGFPYCETDYHNLFSPRCAYCNGPILDKCVTALEKTWHTEHFFCAQCGQQFGEEGFHERDGKPYCRNDYFDMFAPKCSGCNRAIMENYISALNSQWHPDCFVCRDCHQPFHGGSFFDHEGLPYCETHYHAKRGSLCAGCAKPITGRCITAMFRKFHPEHFVCAFCLKQLNKGTFKEQNDKPYCHQCFDKLFG
ncbi:leupaxin isoform X2 [Culicoides brevitarsis]|uniref:leupaxin isoform X2 n=1 Tax=Culicoides brevitarsis TaxID=469753 RepID=UPI00307CA281